VARAGALTDVFHAWWQAVLAVPEPTPPAPDVLDFLVSATGELVPWLAEWPTERLVDLVDWAVPELTSRGSLGEWATARGTFDGELRRWLLDRARPRLTDEDALTDLDMLAEEW
jgi:hypothetical protein